jgi:hypothetical protein
VIDVPRRRRIALLLAVALMSGAALANGPGAVLAAAGNPNNICSPGQLPTQWQDDLRPPPTIRVKRTNGPDAGTVETVDFWDYVATVLRAEFATGDNKPPEWMRMGALAVKQYGWYYTMHWRGGRVSVTNPDDGTTTVECYDVLDNTIDQIYKPEKWNKNTLQWEPINVPTLANYRAMAETWDISVRKWVPKKGVSKMFLTGYRAGRKRPCGTDATGFKIKQKSLRDCGNKGLTFEETLRQYFEPRLLEVDTRSHDALPDGGTWMGDLGLLDPGAGSTEWRLYPATEDGFGAPVTGTFGMAVSASGVGNVDSPSDQLDENGRYLLPAGSDPALLSDLIMLNGSRDKLLVARAAVNGNGDGIGYDTPAAVDISGGSVDRLLVGDFNGDLLADAGLLRDAGNGTAVLSVMLSRGDGTFGAEQEWWSGPLHLTSDVFVAAGDVNGDGKADLITRDAAGVYYIATSPASCSSFATWGVCPNASMGAAGLNDATTAFSSSWPVSDVKNVVGDFDRDGRDDVIAVVKDGSGARIYGLHSQPDGTFAQQLLATLDSVSWNNLSVAALNANSDGMADLALAQKADDGSTSLQWLRTNEKTKQSAASMTATSAYDDSSLNWSSSIAAF